MRVYRPGTRLVYYRDDRPERRERGTALVEVVSCVQPPAFGVPGFYEVRVLRLLKQSWTRLRVGECRTVAGERWLLRRPTRRELRVYVRGQNTTRRGNR